MCNFNPADIMEFIMELYGSRLLTFQGTCKIFQPSPEL